MDKEPPYETFQFIETSNSNPDMNQLLVLQEDGTLLSMNKDIQYIAQPPEVKEGIGEVETCAVFDVTSQQFYVDVDNASNLIVPPDHFAIHHPDSNIYSNSFLIQPENSAASEPMETESNVPTLNSVEQTENESGTTDDGKPANNFTEITLTDAQYQLLEQKGWVLLEFSERIFVLDTLGLHDITTDEKLIQKLKSELEGTTDLLIESEHVKTEDISRPTENIENEAVNVETPVVKPDHSEPGNVKEDDHNVKESLGNKPNNLSLLTDPAIITDNPSDQKNDGPRKECDSIKIKTKYIFRDIPDKIFLGKTVNGKKLYAKVTKSKHKEFMNMTMCRKSESCQSVDTIDDVMFINIVQDYIRASPSKIRISNVIAADSVVTQLMRMPHIKDTVMGNYVVVTKTVIFVTAGGKEKTRHKPITVTGEVKPLDDTHGRFVHTPDMLHVMACPDSTNKESSNELSQEFVEFVHIHITETKVSGKPSVQAINVCNRKLSLDVIRDAKKRYPNPVYACGACACVFKSQSILRDHVESHCPGNADPADDTLTIDTDQLHEQTDTYYILDTGFHKWYCCTQCEAKFSKLFNCKKHINLHPRPIKKNSGDDDISDSEIKEYKCQMCSSKYFHASSLSKHFVKRHILLNTNTNKP